MKRTINLIIFAVALLLLSVAAAYYAAGLHASDFGGTAVLQPAPFPQPLVPWPQHRNSQINYQIDPSRERYCLWLPEDYRTKPCGLIIYMSPTHVATTMPPGWLPILKKQRLGFAAPQNVGNSRLVRDRLALGLYTALVVSQRYNIDPQRIYLAGLSGGARQCSQLAMYYPEIFRGTIQSCGTDFYREVPAVHGTSHTDTEGNGYGLTMFPTPAEIQLAKQRVRFALVTGSDDFRRGNILDIVNGGFLPDGFQCKLFDIQGMGHEDCSAETLSEALDFIQHR